MDSDSLVAASEPEVTAVPTEAPPSEAASETGQSEPVYTVTVGTADNPMHVIVDNADDLTAPLVVPLALVLFALAAILGAHVGRALNWWKW